MPNYNKSQPEEVKDESPRRKSSRQEEYKAMEAPGGEMASPSPIVGDPVALLASPQMAHPANAPLRAQAVAELQRQRGNTYVQQVMKRVQAEKGSGRPLDRETRAEMETAFGQDFGDVRVHTDSEADKLAKELGATAFTADTEIFFRQGQHAPRESTGQRLLAHELTHVVQQSGMPSVTFPKITQPTEAAEIEAEAVEQQAGVNPITVSKVPSATIAREEVPTIPVPVAEYREEPYTQLMPIVPTEREAIERMIPTHKIPDLTVYTFDLVERDIRTPNTRQRAIEWILMEVGSTNFPDLRKCVGETMKYDPSINPKDGWTDVKWNPSTETYDIKVSIGDNAFLSPMVLYTTMSHEYQHVEQKLANPQGFIGEFANPPLAEFEAYSWEILNSRHTGIDLDIGQMESLGNEMTDAWNAMTSQEQLLNYIKYTEAKKVVADAVREAYLLP